jgi:hypothetical protein
MSHLDEPIDMLSVDIETLALPIGAIGASDVRALIPLEAHPMKTLQNRGFRFFGGTRLVRVLDAKYELTTL